jgi:hypothetical protein
MGSHFGFMTAQTPPGRLPTRCLNISGGMAAHSSCRGVATAVGSGSWPQSAARRRRKGRPPCNSGMAEKETLSETGTHENCRRRKDLTVAGMRKTRTAKVAGCGAHDRKRYNQVNRRQETQEQQKDGKRPQRHLECNNSLRELGPRQHLQDPDTRRQLRLRMKKTSKEVFREKTAKWVARTSGGLRKNLWRGRPPP